MASSSLTHFEPNAVFRRRRRRLPARVALIDKGHFDLLPGGLLDRLGQIADLGALLLISCGDFQGQQVAERVHGDMHLGARGSRLYPS